jgi:hypothetical protein
LKRAKQQKLVITRGHEAKIPSNIEVAQLIHLMLKNQNVPELIATITSRRCRSSIAYTNPPRA